MKIISKLEEIKELIKTDLDNRGFTNYNYFIGRPELYDDDIQKNSNLFPMMLFTNINYNLETQVSNSVYIGKINISLVVSDVDNNEPIFDYLDNNIVNSVLETLVKTNDVQVNSRTYDDSIDCIYSIILDLDISFQYEL